MAIPSTREEGPEGGAEAGTSGAVTGVLALIVLLLLGLILRLTVAYVLLPGSGFPMDLGLFRSWANDIAQHGPIGFYARTTLLDYPPVYLLLLGFVSRIGGGDIGEGVKLVPILADLGLAVVVYVMVMEMGGSTWRALAAAVVIIVNPITWFSSAIWGQADAVGSILFLLGLRELQRDHREAASVFAVLAAMTKLQLGVLAVLVSFVVLRRSLTPKDGKTEPERIVSCVGAGLITMALACLPFTGLDLLGAVHRATTAAGLLTLSLGVLAGIGVFRLAERYLAVHDPGRRTLASLAAGAGTVILFSGMVFDAIVNHVGGSFGEYPFLTVNAYNPWALVSDGAGAALARSMSWLRDSPFTDPSSGLKDPGFVVGPFPIGVTLAGVCLAALLGLFAYVVWNDNRRRATADEPVQTEAPESSRLAASVNSMRAEMLGLAGAAAIAAAVIAGLVALSAIGQVPAVVFGEVLMMTVLIGVSHWAGRHDDPQSLLVALTVLTIAFFVVPTRVHERYLFPFFAIGTLLLAVSWRWRIAYVLLAVANTANLVAVLVQYGGVPDKDGTVARRLINLGHWIVNAQWIDGIIWPIALSGVVTGLAMIWALLQLRSRATQALAREVEDAACRRWRQASRPTQ